VLGVLLLICGCATVDQPAPPDLDLGDPQDQPGMRLRVVDARGESAPMWSDKRDVFLGLFGMVTAADIVDADYAFEVIDQQGNVLSLDDEPCRRFHVDAAGQLVMIDSACRHDAAPGIVQLAPFADVEPDSAGTMHFIVQIAPAGTSFAASALKTTFAIAAWPSS
jgi:hypothetical protein